MWSQSFRWRLARCTANWSGQAECCPAKRFPVFVENFSKVHRRVSFVVSQLLSDAFPLWSQSIRCRPASQHSQLLRSSQVLSSPNGPRARLFRRLAISERLVRPVWNFPTESFPPRGRQARPIGVLREGGKTHNLRAPCPASLEFPDGFVSVERSTGKTHRGP